VCDAKGLSPGGPAREMLWETAYRACVSLATERP